MLSLLAAPMGLEISVVSEGGPPPQFAVLQHPPSPFMINGMGGLTELLQQLQRQRPTIVQRAPTNPCLEDMRRLRCTDSICLKRAADDLAPDCAAFLLGAPEASPAPEASDMRSLLNELARGPTPTRAVPSMPSRVATGGSPLGPSGFYTMMSSDSSGVVHRSSGTIGPMGMTMRSTGPMATSGPMLEFTSFLPPELRQLLGGGIFEIEEEEDGAEEEEEGPPMHPCAREIGACQRGAASPTGREALEHCLVEHFEQLSSECKCFVHHVVGSRPPTAAAAIAKPPVLPAVAMAKATVAPSASKPVVVAVPLSKPAHDGAIELMLVRGTPPTVTELHPLHRLSCLFLFSAILLVSIMLGRACVLACFPPRAAARRRVVLVPPEHAVIRAVDHPEARIVTDDAKAAVVVTSMPVQVAEPLVKA